MFEDSLVESSGNLARRNPWTAGISFAVQFALLGVLLLTSLIYTETLPAQKLMSMLEAPVPPAAAPAPAAQTVARRSKPASEFQHGVLMVPREIPKWIGDIHDEAVPSSAALPDGIVGSIPVSSADNAITNLLRSTPAAFPKAAPQKVRVSSGVAQGLLVRQIKPQYPKLALQARIQGTVTLQATIGRDGTVQNLHVLSGHPMLTGAAMDAVRQWLYRPYYLNGDPVEVDTQINVNFTLANE